MVHVPAKFRENTASFLMGVGGGGVIMSDPRRETYHKRADICTRKTLITGFSYLGHNVENVHSWGLQ